MKTLYMIGGTMGVGKTTVCRILKNKLNNSVWLDGDWCWDMNPFQVNAETKAMVLDNICHMLNNFIHCPAFDNIIFCWVLHQQEIIDSITGGIDAQMCRVVNVSLVCDETALRERIVRDIEKGTRTADVLERSIKRIPLYENLNTLKISTSDKSPEDIAEEISLI